MKSIFKAFKRSVPENKHDSIKAEQHDLVRSWTSSILNLPTVEVPDPKFIEHFVLQRTDRFKELGGGPALRSWFETGETYQISDFLLSQKKLETFLNQTIDDLEQEWRLISRSCDHKIGGKWVSIGPGNGMFEMVAYRTKKYDQLLLIDIETTTGKHHHGFETSGAGYASLAATKKFLLSNGLSKVEISTCNPHHAKLPASRFDFLISLYSMGFHYPIEFYVDYLMANSAIGSRVVLDVRKETTREELDRLETWFSSTVIVDRQKSQRLLLTRQN
ncbi:hypothetical protein ABLO27_13100 [Roseibium sp. SCPC15]|uniref:hypothetical protein n=1 Tax=Roseibium sp. SCP15 TaxID=3141376 RepID=UPI00333A3C05